MIVSPIVVIGAPRSGTTILEHCLAMHPDLWHLPGESHSILEGPFHPARRGYDSNRVTAEDLDERTAEALRRRFYQDAINLNLVSDRPGALLTANSLSERARAKLMVSWSGRRSHMSMPGQVRLLEKTPKNTLRVPMLERLFPEARYVFIRRKAEANIDSLIAGWHAVDRIGPFVRQRFAQAGYPIARELRLRDYAGKWWKFALVPGWRSLAGKSVADVAAMQYFQCNQTALEDLANIDQKRVFHAKYEDFVQHPVDMLRAIFDWAGLAPGRTAEEFASDLPRINDTSGGSQRRHRGLRHGEAVYAAMQGVPEMGLLQASLGYRA